MGYVKFKNFTSTNDNISSLKLNDLINKKTMPFLSLFSIKLKKIKETLKFYKAKYDSMFVIGIGGSSLGTQAVYEAIYGKHKKEGRKLYFLENVDPFNIHQIFQIAPWDRTVYTVISKSGTTLETMAIFNLVLHELKKRGFKDLDKRIIVISETGSKLHKIATEIGAQFFEIPKEIGGRFSVLTPVGLVPLEFTDIDPYSLVGGALETVNELIENPDHPLFHMTVANFKHYEQGKNINVLMPYSDSLRKFSDWWVQLWGESLGKDGKGQTPLPAIGTVDQHSLLQLFIDGPNDKFYQFIKVKNFGSDFILPKQTEAIDFIAQKRISEIISAEFEGTVEALKSKKRPLSIIEIDRITPETIGALIIIYMIKTVLTAKLMNINPFGQPGVEIGKKIAKNKLSG